MREPADAPALPRSAAVFGFTIFASAGLPFAGETSVLQWLVDIWRRDPVGGLMATVMFGSPFLFGLAVAAGRFVRGHELAAALIKAPLVVFHGMLALYALILAKTHGVPLRLAFIGFTAVASVYFVYAHAEAEAVGRPLGPRWLARWGAVLVAGTALWLRMQRFDGRALGPALELAIVGAAMLAASLARPRVGEGAAAEDRSFGT